MHTAISTSAPTTQAAFFGTRLPQRPQRVEARRVQLSPVAAGEEHARRPGCRRSSHPWLAAPDPPTPS